MDEFVLQAKLFMSGKIIDYHEPNNQERVVAMMVKDLCGAVASWFHARVAVDCKYIRTLKGFSCSESIVRTTRSAIPCTRIPEAVRQTSSIDEYVARFCRLIARVAYLIKLICFVMF